MSIYIENIFYKSIMTVYERNHTGLFVTQTGKGIKNMKKTKLLIPLLTASATACAVTPLLVSCGNKLSAITGEEIYVPTVKTAEAGLLNRNDANTEYFKHAKDDPEVFIQDIRSDLSRKAFDIEKLSLYTKSQCLFWMTHNSH